MRRFLATLCLAALPAAAQSDSFDSIGRRSRIDLTMQRGVCGAEVIRREPDRLVLKLTSHNVGVCGSPGELVLLPRANIQSIFRNRKPASEFLRPVAAGTALAFPIGLGAAAITVETRSPTAGRAVFAAAAIATVIVMLRGTPGRFDIVATGVEKAINAPRGGPAAFAPAPEPATALRLLLRSGESVRE
jgi:hypothetical protein